MELFELKADLREKTGKGPARVLRRDGKIPAILYGPNTEPIMLSVAIRDLENAQKESRSPQVFVDLLTSGTTSKQSAMLKELHVDPLSREYLHADFYAITMDQQVSVMVPVVAVGKSIGVENGGLLQIIRRELEVTCRPLDVPEQIEIEVTNLEMGESIHVADITVGEKTDIPYDVNFTVITCLAPKGVGIVEEEGEEEGEEAETAVAE